MSTINDIQRVHSNNLPGSIPSLRDYDSVSKGWAEQEFRVDFHTTAAEGGYWTGQAGFVSFDSWPYSELCVIVSGRVAVEDHTGNTVTFGSGDSFLIPQGFSGTWHTLEPTAKVFVGIKTPEVP